jgi:hypothetical protein
MPRTTVDIDAPLLRDLKRLQKREGLSLGRLVSDLLGEALGERQARRTEPPAFEWRSRPMAARIDLADKDAVQGALDRDAAARRAEGWRS